MAINSAASLVPFLLLRELRIHLSVLFLALRHHWPSVHDDPIELGVEARAALEASDVSVDLDEGVLHDVERGFFVANVVNRAFKGSFFDAFQKIREF